MTCQLDATTRVEVLEEYVRARHRAGEDVDFQYDEALPDALMEAMAAVIDAAPNTSVRIYSVGDGGPDFDWLRGLEKVRHLKVEVTGATSFEPLARFSELRSLLLGATISKRPSLSVLASFPQLVLLSVDKHVKGAEAISELRHLRSLGVGGVRDEQWLRRVGPLPALERLSVGLGSVRDLNTLPGCPRLNSLRLTRVAGLTHEHLRPISACRNLQSLDLNQLKHVTRLPDLSAGPAETLRWVVLKSLPDLETLSELLALTRLRLLQLTDTVPRDERIRNFANIAGLHMIVDGRYPEEEIKALRNGYRGETLEYRREWLVGTRPQRAAAAAALRDDLDGESAS
jgi:hypothetical protein